MNADIKTSEEQKKESAVFITTVDNPYDPSKDTEQWYEFDVLHGYNTCAYLARIAKTSNQLSDEENEEIIEKAIDEIIALDFMNIYRKVKKVV